MELPQRLARKQEIRSAGFYGARLTPASGSRDAKGDAETDDELFEFKHTERQSYGVKLADMLKLTWQAVVAGKRPVLEIEFTKPDGSKPQHFVVIPRADYLAMRDELAQAEAKIEADC